jgi:hypothetical protein
MKQKGKFNEVELKFIRGLFAQDLTWKEIVPPYDEVSPSLNLALTPNPNPNPSYPGKAIWSPHEKTREFDCGPY